MSSLRLLIVFIVALAYAAVVKSRPSYYSFPCPVTNPCDAYQRQGWGSVAGPTPIVLRVKCDDDTSRRCDQQYPNPSQPPLSPPSTIPQPSPSPGPPSPQTRRAGGLLGSLFNLPATFADTLLSGELSL